MHKYLKWIAKGILTILLLLFMWSVYPGYVFHDNYLSTTASNRSVATEVLSDSVLVTQYFTPQLPYLISIQIVAQFDETAMREETLIFSVCEENGKMLCSYDIQLEEMESGMYYDVLVDLKVKPGEVYYWSLTAPAEEACEWKLMYTNYIEDQAPENSLFLVGDNQYGGENSQTVSQYNYRSHFDKSVIIAGWWMSGILVYIICLEIADRMLKE